jgi:hypothetical protein
MLQQKTKNEAIIIYKYTPITILTILIEIVFHRPFSLIKDVINESPTPIIKMAVPISPLIFLIPKTNTIKVNHFL